MVTQVFAPLIMIRGQYKAGTAFNKLTKDFKEARKNLKELQEQHQQLTETQRSQRQAIEGLRQSYQSLAEVRRILREREAEILVGMRERLRIAEEEARIARRGPFGRIGAEVVRARALRENEQALRRIENIETVITNVRSRRRMITEEINEKEKEYQKIQKKIEEKEEEINEVGKKRKNTIDDIMESISYWITTLVYPMQGIFNDLKVAAERFSDAMVSVAAFGIENENVIKLMRETTLNAENISNALGKLSKYGYRGAEAMQAVEMMWEVGIATGQGFNNVLQGMQQVMRNIQRPEVIQYLQSLGIQSSNLKEILGGLASTWEGMSEVQKATIAEMLVGGRNAAFLTSTLEALNSQGELNAEMQARMAEMHENTFFKLQLLKSELQSYQSELAENVIQAEITHYKVMSDLMKLASALGPAFKDFAASIAYTGTYTIQTATQFATMAAQIKSAWKNAIGIIGAFTAFIPLIVSMKGPLKTLFGALMAVAIAFMALNLMKNWKIIDTITTKLAAIAVGVAVLSSLAYTVPATLMGYETGGVVPGPPGKPRLAVVHGGETIISEPESRSPINITINSYGETSAREIMDELIEELRRRGRTI